MFIVSKFILTLLMVVVSYTYFYNLATVRAQVMQSSNFQIESDSVNFGGGLSSSTNYISQDTLGEIATGESGSASYGMWAGYQQMQEVYLAMTPASNVVMDTEIGGITGGTSNGSTTVTVTTDNRAGYSLSISAENNPAMQDGVNSISDYDDGGTPDFSFNTGPADSHFGYSPEGLDVVDIFKDNGGLCGAGALETADACWDGLTTSDVEISQGTGSNHPSGSETVVKFKVWVGGTVNQAEGSYVATTTITALPL